MPTCSLNNLSDLCKCRLSHFDRVVGIEVEARQAERATLNAADNGIANAAFHAGSASAIFDKAPFGGEGCAVIVDPPRKGCDQAFLAQLLAFAPRRIVYVSCSPDTQARDLKTLTAAGYALCRLTPFDLFPHTRHVEAVATLEWPDDDTAPSPSPITPKPVVVL